MGNDGFNRKMIGEKYRVSELWGIIYYTTHGHEATSVDKENTAGRQLDLQAHPPRQFKHPQR